MTTTTPPEIQRGILAGKPCDYCPPDDKRLSQEATYYQDVLMNGTVVTIARWLCTRCKIRLMDAVLRPRVDVQP